ncbi:MAG: LysM peptidoglycan-binding domain-containing protein [bacterium]
MKTAVVGGMIVGAHCVVIGSVILMGGCGRTTSVAGPQQPVAEMPRVVMPPEEPVLTPMRVTKPGDMGEVAANTAVLTVETKKYTVKNGDMLSSIAQKHGVSLKDVMKLNKLTNPNKIKVGQELELPAHAKLRAVTQKSAPKHVVAGAGMQVYTVARGDCLSKLASRFGTSSKALRDKNDLTSDNLKVGQKIVVPAKEPAAAAVTEPAAVTVVPAATETAPVSADAGATEKAPAQVEPSVTAPSAAAGDAATGVTHTVLDGETLQTIADKYGVTVDSLKSLNNLTSDDIKPPLSLKIPEAP